MTYIVNPTDISSPSDIDGAAQGAEEFRALKAYIASLIPGGLGGFNIFRKNAIPQGDFQVWQRGTSFAAIASGTYTADLWKYGKVGAMVHTVSRSADVPTIAEASRKIPFSMLVDCTTADAAIAAADQAWVATYVEGNNFVYIAGVGLCLQFWHKHTKVGVYCVAFQNSTADRSFVREYSQAVSDVWEFTTVLIDASPSAGTWDYTTGIGYIVTFTIACGTDAQGVANAWNSANDIATVNQVNACDDVANNFMLAGVQLEKGAVATPYDVFPFQTVLDFLQRYYEKTFQYATAPATLTGQYTGALSGTVPIGDTLIAQCNWRFATRKRTTPTIVTYNPTQNDSEFRNESNTSNSTSATPVGGSTGETGVVIRGSGAAQNPYYIHATADASF